MKSSLICMKKKNVYSNSSKGKYNSSKSNEIYVGVNKSISKRSTGSVRTDMFGNIISKDNKSYKVGFADQRSGGKLVEFIFINDKESVNYQINIKLNLKNFSIPKKDMRPLSFKIPSNYSNQYIIKRPKRRKSFDEISLIDNNQVSTNCCLIY